MRLFTVLLVSGIFSGILFAASATSANAAEPDAYALELGEKAPFAGILMPHAMAARLGTKLEGCELKLKLNSQLFDDTLKLRADAQRAVVDIEVQVGKEKQRLLLEQLQAARAASERAWWDRGDLFVALGVVGGVALTVGAVFLVGELRPLIGE